MILEKRLTRHKIRYLMLYILDHTNPVQEYADPKLKNSYRIQAGKTEVSLQSGCSAFLYLFP